MLKERLRRFWELSFVLAKTGFKLRNEGSYLGILWYLLNPLLLFVLLYFVFSTRLGNEIESYSLYLFLGIIMFNFFQNVSVESTRIIGNYRHVIKSLNFPKKVLIGGSVLKSLFSHFFEIIAFSVFILLFGGNLVSVILYLIVLIFLSIFIFGFSLMLGAFAVHFADLENIWAFASRLLWFGTPIFYSIDGQTKLFIANLFNPMFYFISMARDVVIYSTMPELWMILGGIGFSFAFLTLGIIIFTKSENKFAEAI